VSNGQWVDAVSLAASVEDAVVAVTMATIRQAEEGETKKKRDRNYFQIGTGGQIGNGQARGRKKTSVFFSVRVARQVCGHARFPFTPLVLPPARFPIPLLDHHLSTSPLDLPTSDLDPYV